MASFLFPDKNIFQPDAQDFSETARYIGYSKLNFPDDEIFFMIKTACGKLFEVLKPQAVFDEFSLQISKCDENPRENYKIAFGNVSFFSKDLGRNLKDCSGVYLMAATIGPQVDSVIRREQILNPAMAAVLQAAGAMFAEKLVDYTNSAIKDDAKNCGKKTKPRFSPGYGDVPLEIQKTFFTLLPCSKIGLTLMDTLIMAPEKSVTAFVGSF